MPRIEYLLVKVWEGKRVDLPGKAQLVEVVGNIFGRTPSPLSSPAEYLQKEKISCCTFVLTTVH